MSEPTIATQRTFVQRHRTAIRRYRMSRPVRRALAEGLITAGRTFFDYGCGYGEDLQLLEGQGIHTEGWDPHYRPSATLRPADVVNLGYVLNVIEDKEERADKFTHQPGGKADFSIGMAVEEAAGLVVVHRALALSR